MAKEETGASENASETRDGTHKFEHLPRRVLLPPILCVSGNARNGQWLCFPGTNKGGVSHIAPAHVVDGPLVELVAVRRAAQEALGPGVLMPVRRQLRLAQLRKHGTPPPRDGTLSIFSSWREMWHRFFES